MEVAKYGWKRITFLLKWCFEIHTYHQAYIDERLIKVWRFHFLHLMNIQASIPRVCGKAVDKLYVCVCVIWGWVWVVLWKLTRCPSTFRPRIKPVLYALLPTHVSPVYFSSFFQVWAPAQQSVAKDLIPDFTVFIHCCYCYKINTTIDQMTRYNNIIFNKSALFLQSPICYIIES